ncbi:N-6 DNA methylase [Synechococcus sp. A15-28]|uniref:Eco57I restriction-modification methylase domain-containing protein n=1 Tax=Synechococcus sp. A15-28 TaxID=1050638 RepID=UPI001644071F|nr:N-6 DNA methylase [Synechococcus sp. A15-28]QNI43356.1 Putative Type IIC bifunctional restriction-modification protein with endonuclease and N6-adenine DNA methyltransferase activity [Synechococcus sp. A15-28]
MARTTATVSFQALELKGSLLPASLLEEVSKFSRPKELLLEPKDYGLGKGEGLRERIDAAWVLTKELWEEYTDLSDRAGKSIAGQHFGTRLLKEVFGWRSTQPCNGWQQGESHYPINARAFDGAVPVILRGLDPDDLDRGSAQFGQEGRKRSPHSCLQECLNADDDANWGVLLSGDRLRLLHDNPSLVKPAYLAADLELLIEGGLHAEFAVLWLLLHSSRFQHPQTGSCVLDDWKQQAEASGERVLGALRGGVQSALESLGWGFLNHPSNGELREALRSGQLSRQQFHEQLLRLVYRFLFLFTTEDRNLLFPREVDKTDARRRIYQEGYSVSRLRELAIKRSAYEGDYGDLWELQRLVFQQLSIGNSPLGLPGLGGLFSLEQCPDLQAAELWNGPLLRAIKAIGWFDADGSFTRVRYRDLNTEELGSVYEGLLELHPQLEPQGSQWQLSYGGGAGSDRKTTGSYYTPDALVQELIKSALIPVIDDRLSKAHGQAEQEQALLNIRVIDPACGSGHFLLAAARRLAVALAQVRAGDDQPSEDDRQHALRDVVAHCIYAVDKNPMAVELCKVALWIEAIDPGKPLSFLDAHIQCGDSLVGVFDPKVLEEGIPDGAYKPLTGDNKPVCTSLKKENAAARKTISRRGSNRGIQGSLALSGTQPRSQGQQDLQAIEAMPETTLAETASKQAAYAQWLSDRGQDPETLAADLYTAAFFLAKTSDSRPTVPTTEHLLKLLAGQPVDEAMEEAVVEAAQNFRFFHWHLRFGEVMEQGGFDCVLGNPPWERIKIQEKEFFAQKDGEIAKAKNKSERAKLLEESLSGNRGRLALAAANEFFVARRSAEASGLIARSALFPLTSKGDINLYALFAERCCQALISRAGMCGVIVPTGIATDLPCADFFFDLIKDRRIISILDFRNKGFFPGAAGAQGNRFCLFTFGSKDISRQDTLLAYRLESIDELRDERRFSRITADDITLLNPSSRTCPVLRSKFDFELTKKIALSNTNLDSSISDWDINLGRMFDLANDSDLFKQDDHSLDIPDNHLRLYEAKMVHQFDHRFGDYSLIKNPKPQTVRQLPNPSIDLLAETGYMVRGAYLVDREHVESWLDDQGWTRKWLLGWRDITSGLDERTVIACALPVAAYGNTLPLMMPRHTAVESCILLGLLNSITCDYIARQKVGGVHLTFFILRQLAIPSLYGIPKGLGFELAKRVAGISCHSKDMFELREEISSDLQLTLIPFGHPRLVARAEIEAIAAKIYGLTRDELRYILDPTDVMGPDYPSETFRVLKKNEIREFGEYRTQRLVLEAWDRLFGN